MTAGLPGTGIGGMFYLMSALATPLREGYLRLRGRRSRGWGLVAAQTTLASAILAGLWATGWLLGLALRASYRVFPVAATLHSGNLLPAVALLFSVGTLAVVLLGVEMLRLWVRRRPDPESTIDEYKSRRAVAAGERRSRILPFVLGAVVAAYARPAAAQGATLATSHLGRADSAYTAGDARAAAGTARTGGGGGVRGGVPPPPPKGRGGPRGGGRGGGGAPPRHNAPGRRQPRFRREHHAPAGRCSRARGPWAGPGRGAGDPRAGRRRGDGHRARRAGAPCRGAAQRRVADRSGGGSDPGRRRGRCGGDNHPDGPAACPMAGSDGRTDSRSPRAAQRNRCEPAPRDEPGCANRDRRHRRGARRQRTQAPRDRPQRRVEQRLRCEPPDDLRRGGGASCDAECRGVGPDARDPLLPAQQRGVLRSPAHPDRAGGIVHRDRDRAVDRARVRSRRRRATGGPAGCRARSLAAGAAPVFADRGAVGPGARAPVRAGQRRFRRCHRVRDDRAVALRLDAAVAAGSPALTRHGRTPELRALPGVYRMA